MTHCFFKDASAQVLARSFMGSNQDIVTYDLSFNDLCDSGASIIAKALSNTRHIVSLTLNNNNIGWQGVASLSEALCLNNSLIEFYLSSHKAGGNNRNRVMERGCYELAKALPVNRFLLILDLTGNNICNEGLSYLLPAIVSGQTLQCLNIVLILGIRLGY